MPCQNTTRKFPRKPQDVPWRSRADYTGIAIIDDDMRVDQERINEERRAYLEESRSQEVSD